MLAGKQQAQQQRQIYRLARCDSNRMRSQVKLGNKDLIIRMLAEVFHVSHDCTTLDAQGQQGSRWQQVSTSLVPVSLYSRTTSKWLNYLLAASSMVQKNAANAMSPDSRDFLLLLQQFHQQQSCQQRDENELQQPMVQDLVVFQVVAHDYVAGQCKKILNVKIAQPGTRLGQASDHFVYWKESGQQQLLLQQSSFASLCRQVGTNGSMISPTKQQTWGLNFASVNDAKLFYDICSLNLVDLDFNSEYLKHLVVGDRQLMGTQQQRAPGCQLRGQRLAAQQPTRQSRQLNCNEEQAGGNRYCWREQIQRRPKTPRLEQQVSECPVHSRAWQPAAESKTIARLRSRSNTRQETVHDQPASVSLQRMRSLSTPASPEHRDPDCPVHRQEEQLEAQIVHHPRCSSQIRKQELLKQQVEQSNRKSPRGRSEETARRKPDGRGEQALRQTDQAAALFAQSRVTGRRSTGVDSANLEHLKSELANRDARLARARYANSKNMKEFLSLDAGVAGGQAQMVALSERFQLQQRPRAAQPAHEANLCNASTTTDDLPLDEATRKRMIRLLTSGQPDSRPSRAVSLGPETSGRARSEASRRRSLERSTCVDLEAPGQWRLSPLAQSVSPVPPANGSPEALAERVGAWHQPMSSFKSAPDMARLCHESSAHSNWPASKLATLGTSYAVPLCQQIGGQARQQHQFRSCPNSLRRQRRPHQGCPDWCAGAPVDEHCCWSNDIYCGCNKSSQAGQQPFHEWCPMPGVYRACSSLSSRSPLRFGLYESEADEPAEEDEEKEAAAVRERCWPVKGYDQTMSRASLKSRRAKSQPPAGWRPTPADEAQVSRSVENVQKLIREVQLELNQLSRPLRCQQQSQPRMSHEEDPADQPPRQHNVFQSSSSSTKQAGQFKCVGAIRKAGFLSVKKWIIKRRQTIELARKQGWKRYWVCLRGTALLFHSVLDGAAQKQDEQPARPTTDLLTWIRANCGSQLQALDSVIMQQGEQFKREEFLQNMAQCFIEREPRHLIIIDGAIAQPIPEHPKRDHVFCLSTTFGDAYLFQSSCQLESDNWIAAVHNACAASLARDLTRDEAVKLFETKIRKLGLEAEKKLFLRHRLESRLTSMSSMGHLLSPNDDQEDAKRATLRQLLARLQQQLLTLDIYMEQLHCEIYQLRCYLASCGAQQLFQQSIQQGTPSVSPIFASVELPHPKSLLMHVSRQTKLVLVKLGIFIVSSLHAYIHARQAATESLLQSQASPEPLARHKSQSSSELLLEKAARENAKLERDTEQLIQLADLRSVKVQLSKRLLQHLKSPYANDATPDDDTIQDLGNHIVINLQLHSSSSYLFIIRQVLEQLKCSTQSEFHSLAYYLRFVSSDSDSNQLFVAKRRDTLGDWNNLDQLELMEKVVFRVELNRSQIDEESAPYGISIGAQLFQDNGDSLLSVYCSYIEWASVADKAGLKDDDELLVMNGVPVQDLDMMFVESIIQDEPKLRLVVRSSRQEPPAGSVRLHPTSWQPFGGDTGETNEETGGGEPASQFNQAVNSSQIISDEYILSLVCPPPPTMQAGAFKANSSRHQSHSEQQDNELITMEQMLGELDAKVISKSHSQHHLDSAVVQVMQDSNPPLELANDLSRQLLHKTQQLTQLLGKSPFNQSPHKPKQSADESNSVERLRKSVLELLETEYAYIRHLETISELYMAPLEEMAFLSIPSLRQLNQIVDELTKFQRDFFRKLTGSILSQPGRIYRQLEQAHNNDEAVADLDGIVQQLDSFISTANFSQLLSSLARIFNEEHEEFKIYSTYCVAYSRLQKLLHPKRNHRLSSTSIVSMPNSLDTFISSNSSKFSTSILPGPSLGSQQQREHHHFKPLGSFIGSSSSATNATSTPLRHNLDQSSQHQLKQLSEFLGNLDSSSSSASLSLPKSSSCSDSVTDHRRPLSATGSNIFQKSAHQQSFESYLIKPIQRIVKYPMLLNSIAMSHSDDQLVHSELQQAVKHMESMASRVNDTQRIHDEYGLVFDKIERQFLDQQLELLKSNVPISSVGPHQPPISLDVDQLLHFGPVDWLNLQEFAPKLKKGVEFSHMLFVFTSCVVFICKEQPARSTKKPKLPINTPSRQTTTTTSMQPVGQQQTSSKSFHKASLQSSDNTAEIIRYHSLIPVSEVQVRSVPSSADTQSSSYQWELFRCSSVNSNSSLLTKSNIKRNNNNGKVYLLASPSNEIRNSFLRKIRFIIRESVRNMSLPFARSPSSKSLTPKKLSPPTSTSNTNNSSSCCSHVSISPSLNLQLRLHAAGKVNDQVIIEDPTNTTASSLQEERQHFALATVAGGL